MCGLWDQVSRHHYILGHQSFLLLPFFVFQVVQKHFSQVCLPLLLQQLQKEVFVLSHEFVEFLLVESLVFELALIDFAHACAVKVLAGEDAEVVRKAAIGSPVAVFGEGELAQLVLLPIALVALFIVLC